MENIKCTNCETVNPEGNKYCSNCGYQLPKSTMNFESTVQEPKKEKEDKGKKIRGVIFGIIAFGISYFAVQQLFFKPPSLDKTMMEIASEINKTCPIMVDSETRFDNAVSLSKNVFQYNYTLVNIDKASANPAEIKKSLEPNIINYVKTNPKMQFQRDHQTTLNYYYKDKAGLFLLLISVTPEKYK